MSRKIKAIQTVYKGHKFRSRLEARWAVFFDELNIEWMYEPEGYELNDGSWYLPDFYLPHFNKGLYCEVKFDGGDFSKARMFNETTKLGMLECEGTPDHCGYQLNEHGTDMYGVFHYKYLSKFECRLFVDEWSNLGKHSEGSKVWLEDSSCYHRESIINAVLKAKQERFEHRRRR
jgi:hypothetical protein